MTTTASYKTSLFKALGFVLENGSVATWYKCYPNHDNYKISIDVGEENIHYGSKIEVIDKTSCNFRADENFVVLECVNRLLEKGYKPQNITLEHKWATGHGTSGRLDIFVFKNDGRPYLMIECKTWGDEFNKELKNLERNGGQLFTYFQQDKDAEVLMLYASKLEKNFIEYRNTIVKIEEDYRQTSNVKDFYERWNKLPKTNGVFDDWVTPYEFHSKALTRRDLKDLKQEDSSFIFNRFLEILRQNVVSDKPNAFNKIFTLFLCKIVDENRNPDEQLHFQWLEGEDDHISFQKRLTDLYNRGMLELLEKKVTDVSDEEFDRQFLQVESQYKEKFREILTEIRLKKNNEFAIKEVFDDISFEDNAKVVKEVVELLQIYQIRYNYRQQFLSDFFEMLLTTGLKQESGQFFTPVPIARFILKSLPIQEISLQKIQKGIKNDLLPTIIDYAAGSGHFITESLEIVQEYIESLDVDQFAPATKKAIRKWKEDIFDWAGDYVYAIEKDYRLVKTAKVGCYLHGDGLAKVIHGDGLADFGNSREFKDLLKITDKTYPQDNKQFDVVVSNPPYSVSAFKGTMMAEDKAKQAFELYDRLTDQSSEIECLFIERTKQLLKDGGVAGIILPSSILNNTGIYTKTREIILRYFDILGITELGSNTFMATGTNTVALFLRRRNNVDAFNIEESIKKSLYRFEDVTINSIEKPVSKYVSHVWEGLCFTDYVTLLSKKPNEAVKEHEIYKDYIQKIKAKDEEEKWERILSLEHEKILYFIIAYPQKLVLVKTGEKNEEKRFLGYGFSNRRGSEGIHPIQPGMSIDECTQLFDSVEFDNPEKASTYIYKAFNGEFDLAIPGSLQKNVKYQNLIDMLTFDRVDFEKNISLSAKKKVNYEMLWNTNSLKLLSEISDIKKGTSITKAKTTEGNIPVVAGGQTPAYFHNVSNREGNIITVSASGAYSGFISYFHEPIFASDCNTIQSKDENKISTKLIFEYLKQIQKNIYELQRGQAQPHVYAEDLAKIKIPFPSKEVQYKIEKELEALEKKKKEIDTEIVNLEDEIKSILESIVGKSKKLKDFFVYSNSKVKSSLLNAKNYIGVDNILQKMKGKVDSNFVPSSGVSTEYSVGDILLSNIRPYLQKIWFADNNGGSSNDVLVLRNISESINSRYIYLLLKREGFFDYIMQRTKGVKMPRGDKEYIMDYIVSIPPLSEQQKIISDIELIQTKIDAREKEIADIPKHKSAILRKHLN